MHYNSKYDLFSLSKELGIDIEDMVEIFDIYFIEVNELILSLRYFNQNEDWIRLKRAIHNIKGTSINLKITKIYETAVSVDDLIKLGNYKDIDPCIDKLEELAHQAQLHINSFFVQHELKV